MGLVTFHLNTQSKQSLYTQLYYYIKHEIQTGQLKPGEKLPSKRKLSSYLQISQNTVQAAYEQLMAEGYIFTVLRSGYYVSTIDTLVQLDNPIKKTKVKANKYCYQYDFSYRGVDLESFPFQTWKKINNEVINEYDVDLVMPGDSQGNYDLRHSIANYLHQSRGVLCSAEQIIVSSGTEFLFQLLIQLLGKDNVFALENPGYEKLNLIFESSGVSYVPVSVDGNGMIPEELSQSGANIACITPSHQFPRGVIMPIQRRIQLLNWAQGQAGRYIIEDDYDSEFKYSGKPIPALQGIDSGENVIYIGSFSKSLTPSLRISYVVLPDHLLKQYLEKLSFYICPVPMTEQKCLHLFIERGYFERHLNKMRNIYKKKRELLVSEIGNQLINIEILGANAGLHMLLYVKNGMSEEQLVESAAINGVKVYGISKYYLLQSAEDKVSLILIGYAAMTDQQIKMAIGLLKKAWFLN